MVATVATTVAVIAYRTVLGPYLSRMRSDETKAFGEEYFTKHEQQQANRVL